MSGMSSDSQSDSESTQVMSGINITPFVDVVLVLLVIFMITAPALVKEMIDIKLPKTSTSDGQVLQTLGIALNKEGNILLNGQLTDEENLKKSLLDELKKTQDVQAIISADVEVSYGKVVKLIDLIKTTGVEKFAVQIEQEKKKE